MDLNSFLLGAGIAGLHWWLFGKFTASLTERPDLIRVILLSAARWFFTVSLAALALKGTAAVPWGLGLGFVVVSLAIRIGMLIHYRVKFT